jgi:hypothetical protein
MDRKVAQIIRHCFIGGLALYTLSQTAIAGTVVQTNLVSDIPGEAANTDPNLLNPWGISFSATSPFWVSDQASNVSTLYSATGAPVALVVSIQGGPTGQVFNSAGAGNFSVGGSAATFLFDTLGGAIYGWNSGAGTTAQSEATTAGASFTGLALACGLFYRSQSARRLCALQYPEHQWPSLCGIRQPFQPTNARIGHSQRV